MIATPGRKFAQPGVLAGAEPLGKLAVHLADVVRRNLVRDGHGVEPRAVRVAEGRVVDGLARAGFDAAEHLGHAEHRLLAVESLLADTKPNSRLKSGQRRRRGGKGRGEGWGIFGGGKYLGS